VYHLLSPHHPLPDDASSFFSLHFFFDLYLLKYDRPFFLSPFFFTPSFAVLLCGKVTHNWYSILFLKTPHTISPLQVCEDHCGRHVWMWPLIRRLSPSYFFRFFFFILVASISPPVLYSFHFGSRPPFSPSMGLPFERSRTAGFMEF